jgi:hypothetical protein
MLQFWVMGKVLALLCVLATVPATEPTSRSLSADNERLRLLVDQLRVKIDLLSAENAELRSQLASRTPKTAQPSDAQVARAIRDLKVIRGMTAVQARKALGTPIVTEDRGDGTTEYEWEFPGNNRKVRAIVKDDAVIDFTDRTGP